MGQFIGFSTRGFLLITSMSLAGCMSLPGGDGNVVSRFKSSDPTSTLTAREKEASQSVIISGLQARQSVLPNGGSFDQVATSVMAANSRSAESELRAARLRAEARSKNWLPTIGPSISLTSLGAVVASIVLDQVLFDHGRKKAERDFAKADVEVAAVVLAQDSNERVYTALSLYITAQQARERAALSQASFKDMSHFEWIMEERVKGGVSDMSDLNVLRQKLAEIRSNQNAQTETAGASFAELNAMSVRKLNGVSGMSGVSVRADAAQPLSVMLAEAEKERAIAEAVIARAGHLPGLGVSATAGSNSSGPTLTAGSDTPIGFGTGASLKAIEAAKEGAGRKVSQAVEEANRRLARLQSEAQAAERQAVEAQKLTAQAKQNLDLFQSQYDAGQRQVMDVVGVYETFASAQQNEVQLKYRAVLSRLEIAQELGLLADGSEI